MQYSELENKIVGMTIECQPVTAISAAIIFPIDFKVTSVNCKTTCSMNVNVTYTNTGDLPGSFTPTITIDEISYSLPMDTLNPSQDITKTFSLSGLTIGPHKICSDSICKTVELLPNIGLLGTGLLFGFLMLPDYCKDYKTKENCRKNKCHWLENKCIIDH